MTSFNPLYVVQELSARCYAGCRGCFRGFIHGPLDGDMTEDVFEAAKVGIPSGTMILPQFHGESLLHPQFDYFMKRYADLDLRVSIPVSAAAGEKHLPLLVSEGTPCYVVIVSVDGLQHQTHAFRRGSISLARAERFVRLLLDGRGERKTPSIAVRWVEGGQSEIEFEYYLRKWLFEVGVDFVLRSKMFTYGDEHGSRPILDRGRCHALLEGAPVVLFNGDVLLCERTIDRERFVLGNVLSDSWEKMMDRRDALVGNYPDDEPCTYCSAAYLLTGMKGVMQFRHVESSLDIAPVFVHSDHSQEYYSLKQDWSGINWKLRTETELQRLEYGAGE